MLFLLQNIAIGVAAVLGGLVLYKVIKNDDSVSLLAFLLSEPAVLYLHGGIVGLPSAASCGLFVHSSFSTCSTCKCTIVRLAEFSRVVRLWQSVHAQALAQHTHTLQMQCFEGGC